ncbi:MAG: sigma-70 family RNA polymerase sigma factor [Pirellula sp.]|jgi:RNA polymerase sigma-70 factor (ECF subfamily)
MLSESETIQVLIQARSRIAAAAWLLTRDYHSSEDCFQNVLLKAITKEVYFPSEAALISWALVVIRRDAMDWLDRRGRKVAMLDDNVFAALDAYRMTQSNNASKISALEECIGSLGEDGKRLLQLRYFDGMGCAQIAKSMRLSLPAVYKRLSRLHESLAQCVQGKLIAAEGGS